MKNTPDISASIDLLVQFYHLDPMEIVWHGNYSKFLENARCELLNKIGYNYEEMRTSGYAWPIVDMRIKYVKPAVFQQRLLIVASLKEYENRLVIDYRIRDHDTGELLTKAQTKQVAVHIETGEMQFQSPDILINKVEEFT